MSSVDTVSGDLAVVSDRAKTFIGDFFYAPMGIESSDLVNSITLYALLGLIAFAIYRIAQPAPHARPRRTEYHYGRNV